jgi:ectoine hydroxylase-related dioxygenase (phytanoyl-CoA dioxygenase family)
MGRYLTQVAERCLDTDGYAVFEEVVGPTIVGGLVKHLQTNYAVSGRQRDGSTFGVRNLLRDSPNIAALACLPEIRALVEPVLGPNVIAVRGILFDKTPGANWTVPWHQDLSIPVIQREEIAGFGPWSVKAGVPHVQPPVDILRNMLTVRLHLDDCGLDNGPLLVIPGSHAHGILLQNQADELRKLNPPAACAVHCGGVVLMRPLLLHASHSAESPGHRRVIHLEFSGGELPAPLRWHVA